MIKNVPQILLFFSLILLILNVILVVSSDTRIYMNLCSYTNFTHKSSYENDLKKLLSNLSANSKQSNSNGYYATNTSSLGSRSIDSETIYGQYICRGDIPSVECNEFVSLAIQNMPPAQCPTDKSAVIWYDKCMVRYSNVPFFGTVDESVHSAVKNTENIQSNPQAYMHRATDAFQSLAQKMSNPTSTMTGDKRYFGTQIAQLKDSIMSVYTMVQCTPDLAPLDCGKCLQILINDIPSLCGESMGCRILNPSCNIRYELYDFSDVPMALPPSPSSSPSSAHFPSPIGNFSTLPTGKKGTSHESHALRIALGCLGVVLVILVVVFIVLNIMKKRRGNDARRGNTTLLGMSANQRPNFDNVEDKNKKFSGDNKIGEGGFGGVYKAPTG